MNNLTKRILTGIVLIIVLFSAIWINKYTILLLSLIFTNISIFELTNVLDKINFKANRILAYIFNSLFLLSAFMFNQMVVFPLFTLYLIILFVLLVLDENSNIEQLFSNIFVSVYLTFPYTFIILMNNKHWILYAFAISAFTDTFAYIFGLTIGRHKLLPKVSPKKTVEGSLGGIFGAVLFTFIFIEVFNYNHQILNYFAAIVISIVSQFGDLFASYIKRKADVKDYGTLLVGHGGILDRFDSLLLVAPLVYILVYNLR